MKNIFKIIIFLSTVGAIIGWIFVVRTKENELLKSVEGKMVYFYGQTCPHCANVEKIS